MGSFNSILTRFLGMTNRFSKINHLGNTSERLQAQNRLPKSLLSYFETQTELTTLFQHTLSMMLATEVAQTCQVVRYAYGELIISTPNNTLINHLRYLSGTLIESLKQHQEFYQLQKLSFVLFDSTATFSKTC